MPKVSRETAAEVMDVGVVVDRHSDLDGYNVSFLTFNVETDGTELLRGLPGDVCQCPHWGYVFEGRMGFRFADHDEWYEAGDAYYAPPGHIPFTDAATEVLMISPADEMRVTEEVMMANFQKMQTG
jgi:hypothetical protein